MSMPKIEHIIGEGPELAESQRRLLELLEKHPGYVFRMQTDDLGDIRAWLAEPDVDAPPTSFHDSPHSAVFETQPESIRALKSSSPVRSSIGARMAWEVCSMIADCVIRPSTLTAKFCNRARFRFRA